MPIPPESPPGSPEDRGTPEERSLLARLLRFRKQRPRLDEMPPEAQEDLKEVTRKVGKPHVPGPQSKN